MTADQGVSAETPLVEVPGMGIWLPRAAVAEAATELGSDVEAIIGVESYLSSLATLFSAFGTRSFQSPLAAYEARREDAKEALLRMKNMSIAVVEGEASRA